MARSKRSRSSRSSAGKRSRTRAAGSTKGRAERTSRPTRGSRERSGSSPAPLPTSVLGELSRLLGSLGVRWYLFGAQAVAVWGRPRLTADVDVTAELGSLPVRALVAAARDLGFSPREKHIEVVARELRVVPLEFGDPAIPVDVVLSGPGLEETFLERARLVRIGAQKVPVISPEDLVVAKLIAGRPKDREDVRGILAERGGDLDTPYIRALLSQVEEALGRSDLVPLLEELGPSD